MRRTNLSNAAYRVIVKLTYDDGSTDTNVYGPFSSPVAAEGAKTRRTDLHRVNEDHRYVGGYALPADMCMTVVSAVGRVERASNWAEV